MIFHSLKKEALIILSDIHSIGVLLILPVAFMLIMTFAMSAEQNNVVSEIHIKVSSNKQSDYVQAYQDYLKQQGFKITTKSDLADVHLILPPDFENIILIGGTAQSIELILTKSIPPQKHSIVIQLVQVAFSKLRLHAYMLDSGDLNEDMSLTAQVNEIKESTDVSSYFSVEIPDNKLNSATLYSVPSWIVFGLYFIVLPISITVINEKQNGTLIRLKTFPISTSQYFLTKVSAFFLLSSVQFVILTVIGVFAVPVITEQPTIIINNWPSYLGSALFIVLSANALAFLIAALVNSYEQAIVLGGGINILLAAVSGFMVPIDIMPPVMANIARYSPLYWSAEVIRAAFMNSSYDVVLPYLIRLISFSAVSFIIARYLFVMKIRKLVWN
tara:strand:- start:119 stop:1279 length:1161 start_codon:yes stop_codon:yes gene_type:complete